MKGIKTGMYIAAGMSFCSLAVFTTGPDISLLLEIGLCALALSIFLLSFFSILAISHREDVQKQLRKEMAERRAEQFSSKHTEIKRSIEPLLYDL